jgi:hypothetical protein
MALSALQNRTDSLVEITLEPPGSGHVYSNQDDVTLSQEDYCLYVNKSRMVHAQQKVSFLKNQSSVALQSSLGLSYKSLKRLLLF